MTAIDPRQPLRASSIAPPGARRPTNVERTFLAAPRIDRDPGFPALAAGVAEQIAVADTPRQALDAALTLGGRIPARYGAQALLGEQAVALEAMDYSADDAWFVPADAGDLVLGLRRDGRLTLDPASHGDELGEVRGVRLGLMAAERRARELLRLAARRARDREQLRRWVAELGDDGRLALLEEIQYAAAHGAPLILLVEDVVFSNFRFVNNLAGKVLPPTSERCTCRQLAGRPPEDWTEAETGFVFGAALLLRAGGPAGLEECSGLQITRRALRIYLAERSADLELPGPRLGTPSEELQAAERLAEVRGRRRATHQAYRRIDAIHGTKREDYFERERLAEAEREVVRAWAARSPFVIAGAGDREGYEAFLSDWLPGALAGGGMTTAAGDRTLPDLVASLVDVVGALTGSDITMSRGVRSVPMLVDAVAREAWTEIIDWPPPNFYCCVLPSAETAATTPAARRGELVDHLWSIAARMQYNVWHSLADNVPMGPALRERDYVYAQRFPDVARWSDQHHRGHVVARVRHAIRAPGAADIAGRPFNALVDIRLLRREGEPFGVDEVALAFATSRLVARATELAAAEVEASGTDLWVDAFDSAWYARRLSAWAAGCADPFRPGAGGGTT
jgi:hypothetical protein